VLQHHVQEACSARGSTLRKSVKATLLEMRADGSYDRIHEHYFGRTP